MGYKPLSDRALIKPLEAETKTAAGLVLPDTAREKPQQGVVIAIGPGRLDANGERIKPTVKVGERVLYARYGGTELKSEGEKYLLISESDILAVVE